MTLRGFDSILLGALEIGGSSLSIDKGTSRMVPDLLIVLGLGLILLVLLLVWAVYIRKPKRTHAKNSNFARKVSEEKTSRAASRRHKRRVRRREHRSRNPTLAQTGGFPGPRKEESGTQPSPDATQ
jgi:hypothetical protein